MPLKLVESTAWPPMGPVHIWQEPLQSHVYVIGADTAEGLEHGDAAAAAVLDVHSGLLVATFHGTYEPDPFGEELFQLGNYYNKALMGVEANNHGHTTIATLRRLGYPKIFRRRTFGQVSERYAPQFGWLTNKQTKPKMIDDLGAAIRDGTIDVRDEYTLAELRTYIREYTSGGGVKMHGSPHDDRVMALALAVQMIPYTFIPQDEETQSDFGTFDYFLRIASESDAKPTDVKPLGWQATRNPYR